MVTSLLSLLWSIGSRIGVSVEQVDSDPVENQTNADPFIESSSSTGSWQVFVSFRGEDTRNNFTSHLVAALRRRSINAYIDDTNLRAGDGISEALKKEIEGSRISVVVLSKNYASSAWCLNELLQILECMQRNNQVVVPVFYHVDPSDVRYQKASFSDAFSKHSRRRSAHEVQSWRTALARVANLSGHHLTIHERSEHDFIEKIAKDISTRLTFGSSNNFQDLVGIKSRIEQVTSLLLSESKEVVKVGIWGMGGIGKTTIARAVFQHMSAQFEGCHFIPNVREDFGKHDGNISLRNKLVSLILGEECLEITPVIQDRLQCKKVLIVLDDVSDSMQLDFLRPSRFFGDGSRIIITSRDRQVLLQVVDEIYEVKGLLKGEDLELFSSFAFNARYPEDEFVTLSHRLVECARGVPLALKVLGSSLKGKGCREWESFLHKLKETRDPIVQKILRISYDDLDQTQKDLFLDIASFFRGKDKGFVSEICGASADYDIGVLIDKSLISVTQIKLLEMHDLLQEMGWDIVCQESVKEPGKRSRVWKHEDVRHVLKNNTGSVAVEGINLCMFRMKELHISPTAFSRMNNLRLLDFYFSNNIPFVDQKLYVTGDELCSLSDKLHYLRWDGCPLKSLPLQFCAENLVQLIMPCSNLEKLWDGQQNLENLKRIDLRCSKNLLEIPNLSKAKHLESMNLSYCSRLVEISSIQNLNKLEFLQLSGCTSLCDLPNFTDSTSLETLNLKHCSKITKFPEISESIRELNLNGTAIQEVPASIGDFSRMEYLHLEHCQMLQIIPGSICELGSLKDKEIRLSSFSNLEKSMEFLGLVERLTMEESKYKLSTKQIELVVNFNERNSGEMEWFQNCMTCMTSIKELHCFIEPPGKFLQTLQNLLSLESVTLEHWSFKEFPRCLTNMSSLTNLKLSCNRFETIPESIKHLSALEKLDLSFCTKLQSLPELPIGLKYLKADGCDVLASVSTPFSVSDCARRITFIDCYKLDTSPVENEAQHMIRHRVRGDVKLCAKGCINNPLLIISYPGSEIPKWFSYQSMGSSITIKLPPQCLDNKFLGIAFAAILDLDVHDLEIGVKCGFKSEHGVSHQFDVPLVVSREIWSKFSGRDHVMMGSSCRWHCKLLELGESVVNEASFLFSISTYESTSPRKRIENKIKKCGVCLLYTKDAEEDLYSIYEV